VTIILTRPRREKRGYRSALTPGHGDTTSARESTAAIYPGGKGSFTFHRPTGEGTDYTDATIGIDAPSATITANGSVATAYRLRVKSVQAPTGVTGGGAWSYDVTSKLVVVAKQGAAFTIVVAELRSYS
jgi:hypothetical protein